MQQTTERRQKKTVRFSLPSTKVDMTRETSDSKAYYHRGSREYTTPGWSRSAYQELRDRLTRQYGLGSSSKQKSEALTVSEQDESVPDTPGTNRGSDSTDNKATSRSAHFIGYVSSTLSGTVSYPALPPVDNNATQLPRSGSAPGSGTISYPKLPSQ